MKHFEILSMRYKQTEHIVYNGVLYDLRDLDTSNSRWGSAFIDAEHSLFCKYRITGGDNFGYDLYFPNDSKLLYGGLHVDDNTINIITTIDDEKVLVIYKNDDDSKDSLWEDLEYGFDEYFINEIFVDTLNIDKCGKLVNDKRVLRVIDTRKNGGLSPVGYSNSEYSTDEMTYRELSLYSRLTGINDDFYKNSILVDSMNNSFILNQRGLKIKCRIHYDTMREKFYALKHGVISHEIQMDVMTQEMASTLWENVELLHSENGIHVFKSTEIEGYYFGIASKFGCTHEYEYEDFGSFDRDDEFSLKFALYRDVEKVVRRHVRSTEERARTAFVDVEFDADMEKKQDNVILFYPEFTIDKPTAKKAQCCKPGITAFCERFGIGETIPFSSLVKYRDDPRHGKYIKRIIHYAIDELFVFDEQLIPTLKETR